MTCYGDLVVLQLAMLGSAPAVRLQALDHVLHALLVPASLHGPFPCVCSAPSIARIVGIYQDQQGCCHVALWYYWRWGQINAAADLHPRFRSKYRAQIWLQEEHVEKPKHIQDGGNPVRCKCSAAGCAEHMQRAWQCVTVENQGGSFCGHACAQELVMSSHVRLCVAGR